MEYPTENEDGKVLNPNTGNWVTQNYAEAKGMLTEFKNATWQYYKEQDEKKKAVQEAKKSLGDTSKPIDFPDGDKQLLMDQVDALSSQDEEVANMLRGQIEGDQGDLLQDSPNREAYQMLTDAETDHELEAFAKMVREQIEKDGSFDFSRMPTMKEFATRAKVKAGEGDHSKLKDPEEIMNERGRDRKKIEMRKPTENKRYVRTPNGGVRVVKD